jgi:hypothetical protein
VALGSVQVGLVLSVMTAYLLIMCGEARPQCGDIQEI